MNVLFAQADAARLPLESEAVDLVLGSPPYLKARRYMEDGRDVGGWREADEWVDWMLLCTAEALRVTRGAVVWVCAGSTVKGNYMPGPEGLLWEAHKRGWYADPPVYWHRHGIPGSGGRQGFRRVVEYCLCFKRGPKLPWADNLACGTPPKHPPGGATSHRQADGTRVAGRRVDVKIANPGNLLSTNAAGGGNLGHPLAHLNEAPFPERVPEFFIRSWCPPGGTVLDPFSGSATTIAVAERLGRVGIGFDVRRSQGALGLRRLGLAGAPASAG